MRKLLFILWFLTALLMTACTPDTECRIESTVQLQALFYADSLNTTTEKRVVYAITLDSITVKGVGIDSVLYDNKKSVSSIYLPLQKNAGESVFELVCNGQPEILTIRHTNTENFISLACGCFVYHSLDSVFATNGVIDSIAITNQQVTTTNEEHIRLFFK